MSDEIARLIDFALLHPTLTDADLRTGLELAKKLGVASICIKPYVVPLAAEVLAGSKVAVGTVIGFPHGSHATEVKAFEARTACQQGAKELDMVINVGKALSGDWDYVLADIKAVVDVGHAHGAITKVIFENDYIANDAVKIKLCEVCAKAGAEFVKTSTGFGFVKQPSGDYNYRGATDDDIALMRQHSPPSVGVKAAGGVRTHDDAVRMRDLGCTRLGTSAPESLLSKSKPSSAGY